MFVSYADMLNDLAEEISEVALAKNFWDIPDVGDNGYIPLKLALVHSEVSEAIEVYRKPYEDAGASSFTGMTPEQEEDFSEELADVIIRVLDIIGYYGLEDFGEILLSKIEANRSRPTLHEKRF